MIARMVFTGLAVGASLCTGALADEPEPVCSVIAAWQEGTNVEPASHQLIGDGGNLLLQYIAPGEGQIVGTSYFSTTLPSTNGTIYRLKGQVETGNGQLHKVDVQGASRVSDGTPIRLRLGPQKTINVNRLIRAHNDRINFVVQSTGYGKVWVLMRNLSICSTTP